MGLIRTLILLSTIVSVALGLASEKASCWTSTQTPLPDAPADDIFDYIHDFCTPERPVLISSKQPLRGNWTVGSSTIEISAEIDTTQTTCQGEVQTVTGTDAFCQNHLTQIADQCRLHTNQEGWGSLKVGTCQIWTLGKFSLATN